MNANTNNTKDKWLNSDLTIRKKRCPKCKKYKHIEFLPVFPMPWQMSASFYCFNCHIYIDENGKEDTELMEIMLAVVAQEEAEMEAH